MKYLFRVSLIGAFLLCGGTASFFCERSYFYDYVLFRRTLNSSKYSNALVLKEGNPDVIAQQAAEQGGIIYQNSSFTFWERECPVELDQFWRHANPRAISLHAPPIDISFAGGLQTPSGKDRLVVIAWPSVPTGYEHIFSQQFKIVVIAQDSIWVPPNVVFSATVPASHSGFEGVADNYAIFRMFFGHKDPTDPTSCILPYSVNDQKGIIIGQLGDDDVLRLRYEAGPGKRSNTGHISQSMPK